MLTAVQTYRKDTSHTKANLGVWNELKLATLDEAIAAVDEVIAIMANVGYRCKDRLSTRLALEEALINALQHGNRGNPHKWVTLSYQVKDDGVVAEVKDNGLGFDPFKVPEDIAADSLEHLPGRGLRLMRAHMNWVRYNARGNSVTLCKYRSQDIQQTNALSGRRAYSDYILAQ